MDRYRVTPTFHGSHSPRPTFLSNSYSSLSLSNKPSPHHHEPPTPRPCGRRVNGAELDIFTAERYFGGDSNLDVEKSNVISVLPRDSSISSVDECGRSGRTAASSEASWNSRTGLLSNPPVIKAKSWTANEDSKKLSSSQRWGLFGGDCPCAGKKSVSVNKRSTQSKSPIRPIIPKLDSNSILGDKKQSIETKEPSPVIMSKELAMEEIAKVKITPGNWTKTDTLLATTTIFSPNKSPPLATFPVEIGRRAMNSGGFSFPVLNPATITTPDEPPRDSLEVFCPIDKGTVVLTKPPLGKGGNCTRRSFTRPPALEEEEAISDTSSDLFELESFAASSYPTTYRRSQRNSADELSTTETALSECMYPPSEVSVVWSVATAEGGFDAASAANFSSAASACYDEFQFIQDEHDEFAAAMAGNTGRYGVAGRKKNNGGNGGGGFLNSCRCENAVSVGPSPVRVDTEPQHRRISAVPVVELEVKPGDVVRLSNAKVARRHPARV